METRHKIELMLFRTAAVAAEHFERLLKSEVRRHAHATLAFALPGNVLNQSAQGASGGGLPTIDAIIEIAGPGEMPFEALAESLRGFDGRLAGSLDLSKTGVLAGTEFIVMPGTGPVMLFCPLRRLRRLSREEFQRYWLDVHAEFGRRPDTRYRQFHSDHEATAIAAAAAGLSASDFDGVALAYFDDVAHLRAKLSSPEIAQDAFADEQRFMDHALSQFLPFAAAV